MSNGGINITFFKNDIFINININADKSLDLKIEKGYGKPHKIIEDKKNITIGFIQTILIEQNQCDILSEPYHFESIKPVKDDFKMIKFFSGKVTGFQYLTWSVHSPSRAPYVCI